MRCLAPAIALLLAACDGGEAPAGEQLALDPQAPPGDELLDPRPPQPPTPGQMAMLESRDCRTVAQAYFDALALGEFGFAARFWDDPVIDDARLAALFLGYGQPRIEIAEVREEGAAGSLYCSVTGALSDLANPEQPLRQGEIVLRRVNDVPGATPEQLRWTIRSSTFVEPMERSGKGEPA
jgi:hypothetical protein